MCSLDDLKVVGLVLWGHEVMSDKEIDQDQAAIWLELAIVQCLNDLGKRSQLYVRTALASVDITDRKGFHFIVVRLWTNVLLIILRRELYVISVFEF